MTYINLTGKLVRAWYWDGTRGAIDKRPEWILPFTGWKPGALIIYGSIGSVVCAKPTWVVEKIGGKGCFPCLIEEFSKIYRPCSI
jgi:hypothetical protein